MYFLYLKMYPFIVHVLIEIKENQILCKELYRQDKFFNNVIGTYSLLVYCHLPTFLSKKFLKFLQFRSFMAKA